MSRPITYALKPEFSFTDGRQFLFVVYPGEQHKAHLDYGKQDSRMVASYAEILGRRYFPHLYAKDLINAFELGRAVERREAKPYEIIDEGF
jgi:hypothetical protein